MEVASGPSDFDLRTHEDAVQMARSIGDRRGEGIGLAKLGQTLFLAGDHPAARMTFLAAKQALEETGAGMPLIQVLSSLSRLEAREGRYMDSWAVGLLALLACRGERHRALAFGSWVERTRELAKDGKWDAISSCRGVSPVIRKNDAFKAFLKAIDAWARGQKSGDERDQARAVVLRRKLTVPMKAFFDDCTMSDDEFN